MPEKLDITIAELQAAADSGNDLAFGLLAGRACATVRSRRTGEHITVQARCRRKTDSGWERATLDDATHVFVDVPAAEGGRGDKIATYYPTGRQAGNLWIDLNADRARAWAAIFVLRSAAGRPVQEDQAEIFLSEHCLLCDRELTHPESVQRHVGPECYGKALEAEHQRKQRPGGPSCTQRAADTPSPHEDAPQAQRGDSGPQDAPEGTVRLAPGSSARDLLGAAR